MASNINIVMVTGNCTREPEYRQTADGTGILTFSIAVNDRRRNQQTGEWEDYANFFDCTMFGNRATSLSGIIAKGMHLAIKGKLRWSKWQAQDGSNRSKVEIVADEVELPPRSQQNAASGPAMQQGGGYNAQEQNGAYGAPQRSYAQQSAPQPTQVANQQGVYDSDIPF